MNTGNVNAFFKTDASLLNTAYNICDGPNRDFLFDAVKYAYESGAQLKTTFTLERIFEEKTLRCEVGLRVIQISHEDGSGFKFNLCGYVEGILPRNHDGSTCNHFSAFYNAKNRKGWVAFLQ